VAGHRLTSNDTSKVRTTSALFDLKMLTDLMGCSFALRVIIDAAMIRGKDGGILYYISRAVSSSLFTTLLAKDTLPPICIVYSIARYLYKYMMPSRLRALDPVE
jgi:hypothetical protein